MQQDRTNAAARLFGQRLKEVRLAAGLTEMQVSQRTRISERDMASIEGGNADITLDTMVLLAGAVGAEVWDLVRSMQGSE